MVLAQETPFVINPISGIIKTTILSAFTFLTALGVRDVFSKTLEAVLPDNANEKLIFTYFYATVVIFLTVLFAYLWSSSAKK